MLTFQRGSSGFTLAELVVVSAIITILAAIVLANLGQAREKARDSRRLVDLKEIDLALEVYREENGYYPKESDGFSGGGPTSNVGRICTSCTGPINVALLQYLKNIPEDPLNGDDYYYYYDANQTCEHTSPPTDDTYHTVVAARNMEDVANSNASDATICTAWGGEGGIGQPDSYMIIVGPASP